MAHLTLSQPAPDLSLVPLSENGCNEGAGTVALEKLGLDLANLIQAADEEYSDVIMIVDGKRVPIHRCIIAVRCPSFRKVFAGMGAEKAEGSKKQPELELNSLVKEGRIGYEAFMTVMGYVYGGQLRPLNIVVECWDPSCAHSTCRPVIDYVLELLCASVLFGIQELKTIAEVFI
jgi:regulatory protein NPR1